MSVLFFCVGAAKAGTSWLYSQLAAHPECHFRAIKELHYFDAIDGEALERELHKHQRQQARILNNVAAKGTAPSEDQSRLCIAGCGAAARYVDANAGCAFLDVVARSG